MNFFILNGPNLNLLGQREIEIYGDRSMDEVMDEVRRQFPDYQIKHFQSNSEGTLIDHLQKNGPLVDGIVFNPAAYTHTSIALADTIRALSVPVVEVHISDPEQRAPYRKVSFLRPACVHRIAGKGVVCYQKGIEWLIEHLGGSRGE